MGNKYSFGITRVSSAKAMGTIIEAHGALHGHPCLFCGHSHLTLCPTLGDHYCEKCGKYQEEAPEGYATGRPASY